MTSLLGTTSGLSPWIERTVLSSISNSRVEGKGIKSTSHGCNRARIVQVESIPPVHRIDHPNSPLFFTIHDGYHKIVIFCDPFCLFQSTLPTRYSIIKLVKYHVSTVALCCGREALHNPILLSLSAHNREYYPTICLNATEIHVMEKGGSSMGLATSLSELTDINLSIRIKQELKGIKGNVLTKRLMESQGDSMKDFIEMSAGSSLYVMNDPEKELKSNHKSELCAEMVIKTLSKVLKRRPDEDGLKATLDSCPEILRSMIIYLSLDNRNSSCFDESNLSYHFKKNLREPSFEMLEQCLWDLSEKYPISLQEKGHFREYELKRSIHSVLGSLITEEIDTESLQQEYSKSELFQVVSDLFGRVDNITQLFISIRSTQRIKLTKNIFNAILNHVVELAILSYEVKLCLKRALGNISWTDENISDLKNCGLLFFNHDITKQIRVSIARLDVIERQKVVHPVLMQSPHNQMTVFTAAGPKTNPGSSMSSAAKEQPRSLPLQQDKESQTNTIIDPESQPDFRLQTNEAYDKRTLLYHDMVEVVNSESQQPLDPETQPINKTESCDNETQFSSALVCYDKNKDQRSINNSQIIESDKTVIVGISEMMASEDIDYCSEDEHATVAMTRHEVEEGQYASCKLNTNDTPTADSPLSAPDVEKQIYSQFSFTENSLISVSNSSNMSKDPKRKLNSRMADQIQSPVRQITQNCVQNQKTQNTGVDSPTITNYINSAANNSPCLKRKEHDKNSDFMGSKNASIDSLTMKENIHKQRKMKRNDRISRELFRIIKRSSKSHLFEVN